ncbi:unnamed protein product [Heligmosomoides polygyrus]|uniref:Reverse transcriptase domain-containing protein n=1 Tax=Heligmosomoides polygyrus TaxID=6339 RepID=A0A183FY64_HELPZ|nr:unnamed protein product [Heligmosomoides polygyrus]
MEAITRDLQKPIPWTLLYADDVMLACEDKGELEREVQAWCDRLAMFGLKLNVMKTEYFTTDVNESGSIKINGTELARTSADGSLMVEVNSHVSAAWSKWRSLTGVLCDKNMSERLKSKIYKTVVRPVAMYGAECWPATKERESRLSVMKTKMLPKRDYSAEVRCRADSGQDARSSLTMVRPRSAKEDSVRKIGLNFVVSGKRPRVRTKQRWADTLHKDFKVAGVHPDLARDRERWRHGTRKADPAMKRDKR